MRDKTFTRLYYLSVVIITKNEERVLGRTLASLQGITDDIIIVDSGSTDGTIDIARKYKATVLSTEWLGYGATKNLGNSKSKYDWVLSLDADEAIDETLRHSLLNPANYDEPAVAYDLHFKIFIGEKHLRYGQWLNRHNVKLFNKKTVGWDNALVHELLSIPAGHKIVRLSGNVLHYTSMHFNDYVVKLNKYALLSAEKYFSGGKNIPGYKLYLTPPFTFLLNFVFKLGFLDGWHGFILARLSAYYSFLKYAYLQELIRTEKTKDGGYKNRN